MDIPFSIIKLAMPIKSKLKIGEENDEFQEYKDIFLSFYNVINDNDLSFGARIDWRYKNHEVSGKIISREDMLSLHRKIMYGYNVTYVKFFNDETI